jgi:hypothetical protein
MPPPEIDLGGGLNIALSRPINIGPATPGGGAAAALTIQLVGNDINKPTAAKLAIYNNRGEVQGTRDLPGGWLPLVPPVNPNAPPGGGVQVPGGGAGPGGGALLPGGAGANAGRVQVAYDQATRAIYFVGRKSDNSVDAIISFRGADITPGVQELPAGWFATSCSPLLRLFTLELSRRLAILGSRRMETEFANPCLADAFILADLNGQAVSSIELPAQGQLNAAANVGDVNDYLFGVNSDPSNRSLADTIFVLDGVTQSAFRMNLPTEVTSFAGAVAVPELAAVLGLATNRINGDAGIIYFDLDKEQSRLFPTPEGFQAVQFVGIMTNNRKLVARGVRPQNAGSQYLIYDLRTGDLAMPPNPEGVAYVGAVPAQPGQPGGAQPGQPAAQYQAVNVKSSTVTAVGFNADREPVGILTVRIP